MANRNGACNGNFVVYIIISEMRQGRKDAANSCGIAEMSSHCLNRDLLRPGLTLAQGSGNRIVLGKVLVFEND
jgi:hypothetical protein